MRSKLRIEWRCITSGLFHLLRTGQGKSPNSSKRLRVFPLVLLALALVSNRLYAGTQQFDNQIDRGLLEYPAISEASGVAVSRKNLNVLWTHNDKGDSNRLFAFSSEGKHLGVYFIEGTTNRDWEDIAVGPGPVNGQQYLYIGEIGDNSTKYDLKYIYRVPEPEVDANQAAVNMTITGVERIAFRYPDGRRDAETLMVDPLTKDIYIVSKKESNVQVYRATYPQSTTNAMTLEHVSTLNVTQVVSGDISGSGREVLIKTYTAVYHWYRIPGVDLWKAFDGEPTSLPYVVEPQGEAVAWSTDAEGYYTISEERNGEPAHVYFYPRLDIPPKGVQPAGKLITVWGVLKRP